MARYLGGVGGKGKGDSEPDILRDPSIVARPKSPSAEFTLKPASVSISSKPTVKVAHIDGGVEM